jgi:hypothetical protein
MNAQLNAAERKPILMLILDVKTRWSSTHQMLRKFFIGVLYGILIETAFY